jgi:hypothetical protein
VSYDEDYTGANWRREWGRKPTTFHATIQYQENEIIRKILKCKSGVGGKPTNTILSMQQSTTWDTK